jgi:putative hemolysin
MRTLSAIATPVVWLLDASSNLVIRLLGVKPSTEPSITPEELTLLLEQGTLSGTFEASEQTMIEKVLRLDARPVGAFMTPHTRIVWLDTEDSPADIRRKIAMTRFSRFPVASAGLDHVLGFVRARDLLNQSLAGRPLDLGPLVRAPLFVPENMSALKVLELFKQAGAHMALIVDEYGGVQGLVTQNDILEDIAGYAAMAGGSGAPRAVRWEDGSWRVDGLLPIEELKRTLDLEKLPDEEHDRYLTVGGFVTSRLGGIPTVGQHFFWGGFRFEVSNMDGRRVGDVTVTPAEEAEPHEP